MAVRIFKRLLRCFNPGKRLFCFTFEGLKFYRSHLVGCTLLGQIGEFPLYKSHTENAGNYNRPDSHCTDDYVNNKFGLYLHGVLALSIWHTIVYVLVKSTNITLQIHNKEFSENIDLFVTGVGKYEFRRAH